MIALDADVISGASSVDESAITGEPLPKDKHAGDRVFAGTLNMQGYLEAKVLKPAKISTGFEVPVPLFVSQGDKIEIDTRTGEYRKRV